jgi:hypothetical protein
MATAPEHLAMMLNGVGRINFHRMYVTGQHLAVLHLRPHKFTQRITIVFQKGPVQFSSATQATKPETIRNFSPFLPINVAIKHRNGLLSLIYW